jgi:4-diphosphocytidyl-2-C-methyl-D-erythritol kinase
VPGTGTSVIGDEATAEARDSSQELATRALQRLEAIAGQSLGLGITLRKQIPAGAGLGGGSGDAAAVLRAAPLLGVSVGPQRLHQIALDLGADVPFQLLGGAALVGGVGEVVEPLPYRELCLAVAFGRLHCSTAEVFGELRGNERSSGGDVEAAAAAWRRDDPSLLDTLEGLPNALWAPATRRYPGALEGIVGALEEGGWRPRLTGSGSAMYQVCSDEVEARRLALSASTLGFKAWSCKTVAPPPA